MRRGARIFGLLALILGALSFTSWGSDFAWGALKPASAILFGAFFICKLFAPEYAKYNDEQRARREKAEDGREGPTRFKSWRKRFKPRPA
jgi:hypothetical protein